eukprot:CAMPEP_0185372932 /NCGR_PEP_ID=MMETSP1364-20130426/25674_1 /TAXON_ID=38817 /ORGANISM="Gephyrocapsa oceanica, Strain RCC1303" /LENGTH=164 /DNA_ID=CAMNT_0027973907 /DNA_START=317 /DNA_END=807 /DNA_ORIENTATION=+
MQRGVRQHCRDQPGDGLCPRLVPREGKRAPLAGLIATLAVEEGREPLQRLDVGRRAVQRRRPLPLRLGLDLERRELREQAVARRPRVPHQRVVVQHRTRRAAQRSGAAAGLEEPREEPRRLSPPSASALQAAAAGARMRLHPKQRRAARRWRLLTPRAAAAELA